MNFTFDDGRLSLVFDSPNGGLRFDLFAKTTGAFNRAAFFWVGLLSVWSLGRFDPTPEVLGNFKDFETVPPSTLTPVNDWYLLDADLLFADDGDKVSCPRLGLVLSAIFFFSLFLEQSRQTFALAIVVWNFLLQPSHFVFVRQVTVWEDMTNQKKKITKTTDFLNSQTRGTKMDNETIKIPGLRLETAPQNVAKITNFFPKKINFKLYD